MNRKTDPNVRIYADHIEASFKDFSNQLAEGSSEFRMRGRFMGSGDTRVTGTFRPESRNPNLGLKIAIDNTDMKAMSGIFQAYGQIRHQKGGVFVLLRDDDPDRPRPGVCQADLQEHGSDGHAHP